MRQGGKEGSLGGEAVVGVRAGIETRKFEGGLGGKSGGV
jgi:hypothetical protein